MSMDQAPRETFVSQVVGAGERTAVMGVLGGVKTLGGSGAPWVTGGLVQGGRFEFCFVVAGGVKVGYDLGVLAMFGGGGRGVGAEREDGEDGDGGGDGRK